MADPIPFITDVQIAALRNGALGLQIAGLRNGAIGAVIIYRDEAGSALARTVADADRIEALGRALLSMAFAIRTPDVVHLKPGEHGRSGNALHLDVNLMRNLSITPGGQAATIHPHPPLDRLNAPQDQAVQP